jgi:hypothetical protein
LGIVKNGLSTKEWIGFRRSKKEQGHVPGSVIVVSP